MRIKSIIFLMVGVILFLYLYANAQQPYRGTNLRGRVDMFNPYIQSWAPAAGIVVELFIPGSAPGQWVPMARTATDFSGFYYFSRVNPGQYLLRYAGRMNFIISVAPINYRIQQFQDIPPVRLM